jgi:hypothetical protein
VIGEKRAEKKFQFLRKKKIYIKKKKGDFLLPTQNQNYLLFHKKLLSHSSGSASNLLQNCH